MRPSFWAALLDSFFCRALPPRSGLGCTGSETTWHVVSLRRLGASCGARSGRGIAASSARIGPVCQGACFFGVRRCGPGPCFGHPGPCGQAAGGRGSVRCCCGVQRSDPKIGITIARTYNCSSTSHGWRTSPRAWPTMYTQQDNVLEPTPLPNVQEPSRHCLH